MRKFQVRHSSDTSTVAGYQIFGCLVNILFGGISVNYLVQTIMHQSIDFMGCILIGLFAGTVTVPGAIVVWLLQCAGVKF